MDVAGSITAPVIVGLAVGIAFIVLFLIFASGSSTVSKNIANKENQTYYAFSRDLNNFTAVSVPEGTCKKPSIYLVAANSRDANNMPLKERTWIAVRPSLADLELKMVSGKCTIISDEMLSAHPQLLEAIDAAERCSVREEVCSISYGIAVVDSFYTYHVMVSQEEAKAIAKDLGMRYVDAIESYGVMYDYFTPATFVHNDRLYKVVLHTSDQNYWGAQTTARYLDLPEGMERFKPVNLTKGESYNRTLLITTYATYGGPADIHLSTEISAKDSGITVVFEPDHLLIPERSNATTTLVVTAPGNATDGIYEIYLRGYVDKKENGMNSLSCHLSGHNTCLDVRVDGSNWEIYTTTQRGGVTISGGKETPAWFKGELQTSKDHYALGEDIAIDAYLVNNGNETVVLDNQSRARISVYNASSQDPIKFYSIYASHYWRDYEETPPLVVEPHSKLHIARTFVWDQKTRAYDDKELQNAKPGYYVLDLEFEGLSGVNFDVKKVISIGLE